MQTAVQNVKDCEDNDCDDSNPRVNPDIEEIRCNQIDDDCDGQTDFEDADACMSGCMEAAGNIDEDPQIQSPHDDLHLTADSPCKDAGVDPSTYGIELLSDYDMQPRPADSSWDIGPDEYMP